MVKVDLSDLKKAISWLEVNSPDLMIKLDTLDGRLKIKAQDKYGVEVLIEIYESGSLMPTITHKDRLRT